ncbi:MAG: hypothetical protein F4Y69_07120 [Chloroflexi bacterium]|nr:hypothetical protein [Chloroflexota bacterium]MYF23131.1 hypothetical protein [Chloroflexota bacterium]
MSYLGLPAFLWRRMSRRGRVLLSIGAVVVVMIVVGSLGGDDGTSGSGDRAPTVREQIEDCLDPWDGNHIGFEDQIRPWLRDESSMETHETRFGVSPDASNEVLIEMEYSAENAFGGRVKAVATGTLNYKTCHVTVIDTGL